MTRKKQKKYREQRCGVTGTMRLLVSVIGGFWKAMIALVEGLESDLLLLRPSDMVKEAGAAREELERRARIWTDPEYMDTFETQSLRKVLDFCRSQLNDLSDGIRLMSLPDQRATIPQAYCGIEENEAPHEEWATSSESSWAAEEAKTPSLQSEDNGPQLFLFDGEDYPLCDRRGRILEDSEGSPLVFLDDEGSPVGELLGSGIYDARGRGPDHPEFDPSLPPQEIPSWEGPRLFGGELRLFDRLGRPLVDHRGRVLYTAQGKPLLTLGQDLQIAGVYKNRGVFDDRGIPLIKIDGRWLNPRGAALRLFDEEGRPLTNREGSELYDLRRNRLLTEDEAGRPMYDSKRRLVRDAKGRPASRPDFNPTLRPEGETEQVKVKLHGRKDLGSVPLYDVRGRPLTDLDGVVLRDAGGRLLVVLGPDDVPVSDADGGALLDSKGDDVDDKPVRESGDQARRTRSASSSMYEPNTDRQIYAARNQHPGHSLVRPNKAEVDSFNRPLYDLNGVPQFDRFGRPKYDLRGRRLFSRSGTPLMDAMGNSWSEAEPPGDRARLYTEGGVPALDRYGRPLFDEETGDPLTSQDGLPLSVQVRRAHPSQQPQSVRDTSTFVTLPATLARALESFSLDTGRLYTSIPEKYSVILPEWINEGPLLGDVGNESKSDTRTYQSLVRVTKFKTGPPVYELLELVRYSACEN